MSSFRCFSVLQIDAGNPLVNAMCVGILNHEDIKNILESYLKVYDVNDDNSQWFEKVKSICEPLGFTTDMKAYKQNPDEFKGSVADVSTVIRVAVTGRQNTPDLCTIMQLLGKEKSIERINNAIKSI